MKVRAAAVLFSLFLGALGAFADPADPADEAEGPTHSKPSPKAEKPKSVEKAKLLYTTTFYTATEAVIHGYEEGTHARIISMKKGGTVWKGVVGRGETKHVQTGAGVFRFVSNKKAAILVGTPSACTAVGYFVRDQDGSFRSDLFFTQLPSNRSDGDSRVIIWALDDTSFTVRDLNDKKVLHQGSLLKGERWEIDGEALNPLGSHVLEIKAAARTIQVQVYYDEGFFVPGADGRGAGSEFLTYVGATTNAENDLNLMSYFTDAQVTVSDVDTCKVIWSGTVEKGSVHTLTLSKKYVKITADREISCAVTPYKHYVGTYAEHHFGMGAEGTGIENDFMLTTPGELWIFAYYKGTEIEVINMDSGEQVWKGKLDDGQVRGVHPGHGLYRIKSTRGVSVMGGSSACGAEYSPSAGMFVLDEELFKVIEQIRTQRAAEFRAKGQEATREMLDRRMTDKELKQVRDALRARTGRKNYDLDELQERCANVQKR